MCTHSQKIPGPSLDSCNCSPAFIRLHVQDVLLELSVNNIAIIEKTQFELQPGFTVLSGETGAGKSLLIDSISLVLGERADSSLLRHGAESGSVQLVVEVADYPPILALCHSLGIEIESDHLFLQRDISSQSRSVCRINGKQVPLSTLKQIGDLLVDLHGQHDHQALLNRDNHLKYFDLWIGEPARKLLEEVACAHRKWSEASSALQSLRKNLREREQRIDMLQFQIKEIEGIGLVEDEEETLSSQINRLTHSERLSEATLHALEALQEGESSAQDHVGTALTSLESVTLLDPTLAEYVTSLRSVKIELQETARMLRQYVDAIESDPAALELANARQDAIRKILRKYGEDIATVLAYAEACKDEMNQLTDAEFSLESLENQATQSHEQLLAQCERLNKLRHEHSAAFCQEIESQFAELSLVGAKFELQFESVAPSDHGNSEVFFYFNANAGEQLKLLDQVASGGELSRVMLALKVVLAGKASVPTLIFDEVDSGLSGKTAAVVAKKLVQLSRYYQIIAISHLPQIAGMATHHYKINKLESQGRTQTRVEPLLGDARVEEVARMLAGEEIGHSALANARELIAAGRS